MAEADQNQRQKKQKKRLLPRGTSEYQVFQVLTCYEQLSVLDLFHCV